MRNLSKIKLSQFTKVECVVPNLKFGSNEYKHW